MRFPTHTAPPARFAKEEIALQATQLFLPPIWNQAGVSVSWNWYLTILLAKNFPKVVASFPHGDSSSNESLVNFFVPNVSFLEGLFTSAISNDFKGIQAANGMDVCCPNRYWSLPRLRGYREQAISVETENCRRFCTADSSMWCPPPPRAYPWNYQVLRNQVLRIKLWI